MELQLIWSLINQATCRLGENRSVVLHRQSNSTVQYVLFAEKQSIRCLTPWEKEGGKEARQLGTFLYRANCSSTDER